jgi:hypothetical protein
MEIKVFSMILGSPAPPTPPNEHENAGNLSIFNYSGVAHALHHTAQNMKMHELCAFSKILGPAAGSARTQGSGIAPEPKNW